MLRSARVMLLGAPLLLGGCATIFSGRARPLTVTSNPVGARVLVSGADSGATPRTLRLRRTLRAIDLRLVTAERDTVRVPVPREPHSTLLLNLLGGVWGALSAGFDTGNPAMGFVATSLWFTAVDVITGAAFTPSEKQVHVEAPPKKR